MVYTPEKLASAAALIDSAEFILITTHVSPDGDAIGSSLGLQHLLTALGKKSQVITPNPFPEFLSWMPGVNNIVSYLGNEELASNLAKQADLIFCLDFNNLRRLDKFQETVSALNVPIIMIDHHEQPSDVAKVLFSDVPASSTCEMIYEFAQAMQWGALLNKDAATCIYTGILTDTGSFRFSCTKALTHKIAAHLMELGINHPEIHQRISDTNTFNRLQLIGYALSNKLNYLPDYKCIYFGLSKAEMEQFNYKDGDTEGLVNYGLSVAGVKMSVFFKEGDGKIKISFRSKGNFSVQKLSSTHFDGGGHFNASGGASYTTLQEAMDKFVAILPDYYAELNQD